MNNLAQFLDKYNQDTQIQTVKAAIKQNKNKRMHIRYLVIINHLYGLQNVEIAMNLGLCTHTVGTYIRKYKEGGLENLVPTPNPGAPRRLSDEQESSLLKLSQLKHQMKLAIQIKRIGLSISLSIGYWITLE